MSGRILPATQGPGKQQNFHLLFHSKQWICECCVFFSLLLLIKTPLRNSWSLLKNETFAVFSLSLNPPNDEYNILRVNQKVNILLRIHSFLLRFLLAGVVAVGSSISCPPCKAVTTTAGSVSYYLMVRNYIFDQIGSRQIDW